MRFCWFAYLTPAHRADATKDLSNASGADASDFAASEND
jgi:hypothetical protein